MNSQISTNWPYIWDFLEIDHSESDFPIVAFQLKIFKNDNLAIQIKIYNFSEFSKSLLRHCFVSITDVQYSDVCTWFSMPADIHDSLPKTLILVCSANKQGIIWNSKISSKFSSVLFFKFNRNSRIHDYHIL